MIKLDSNNWRIHAGRRHRHPHASADGKASEPSASVGLLRFRSWDLEDVMAV